MATKGLVNVQMRATLVVEMLADGCAPVTVARWELTPFINELREPPDEPTVGIGWPSLRKAVKKIAKKKQPRKQATGRKPKAAA